MASVKDCDQAYRDSLYRAFLGSDLGKCGHCGKVRRYAHWFLWSPACCLCRDLIERRQEVNLYGRLRR